MAFAAVQDGEKKSEEGDTADNTTCDGSCVGGRRVRRGGYRAGTGRVGFNDGGDLCDAVSVCFNA